MVRSYITSYPRFLNYLTIGRRYTYSASPKTALVERTMAQPKITLYVDIVSPFSYIAFYILKVCLPCSRMQDSHIS